MCAWHINTVKQDYWEGIMNNKNLPDTLEDLKLLNDDELAKLWAKYLSIPEPMFKKSMYRQLWYKICCDKYNLKIKQKHITKLNRYANNPEQYIEKSHKSNYHLRKGVEIIKAYKNRTYRVVFVNQSQFLYEGKLYKTISSVAKEICGKKVSGYDFFGLNNKNHEKNIVRDKNE